MAPKLQLEEPLVAEYALGEVGKLLPPQAAHTPW